MKLDKTVFILGAGASLPYKYPTALQLRNDIINRYDEIIIDSFKAFGNNGEDMEDFQEEIKPLIKKFDDSNTKSIDLFLTRTQNKQFIKIGTELIWLYINWYERHSPKNLRSKDQNEDWYFDFFNELTENFISKGSLNKLANDYITFITFNYDRSLENFLFNSFLNSFPITEEETAQLMNNHFNIHHVYGKIIDLHWEGNSSSSKYFSETSLFKFDDVNRNIKLIYEDRTNIPIETQNFLEYAEQIYCLGFGFAEINLRFLNLRKLINPETKIFATSLGMHKAKKDRINEFLRNNRPEMKNWLVKFEDVGSLQLLRNNLF